MMEDESRDGNAASRGWKSEAHVEEPGCFSYPTFLGLVGGQKRFQPANRFFFIPIPFFFILLPTNSPCSWCVRVLNHHRQTVSLLLCAQEGGWVERGFIFCHFCLWVVIRPFLPYKTTQKGKKRRGRGIEGRVGKIQAQETHDGWNQSGLAPFSS